MKIQTLFSTIVLLFTLVPTGITDNHKTIVFEKGLAISGVVERGRIPVRKDLIQAQLANNEWEAPQEGEKISHDDLGEHTWETIEADDEGWFQGRALRGGYVYFSIEANAGQIYLLDAQGHSTVWVNGVPHYGDPYRWGFVKTPVQLKQGANHFLFQCSRGRLQAKLAAPESQAILNQGDTTLPHYRMGEKRTQWGAILVINASNNSLEHCSLRVSTSNNIQTITSLPRLLPLSQRKVKFQLPVIANWNADTVKLTLELLQDQGEQLNRLDQAELEIQVRQDGQSYKRTFISGIDGSVQYYAVQPSLSADKNNKNQALFLSLHGASVEAIGQANAYAPKRWGTLVAPTNRRPFGFDWEDWGRLDTLEVLEQAQEEFHPDPSRIYLTGHSMGGHGTWNFGATYPSRFAAIGPSAGWISFWSYSRALESGDQDAIDKILLRSAAPSDTLALLKNYQHHGVYILHGGSDKTVPASEAQEMYERLKEFHPHVIYHEEPEKGHWWNISKERGTDCVDWLPMFDFFAKRRIPSQEEIRDVSFVTVNPEISSQCHWLSIHAQQETLKPSRASIRFETHNRRFVGTTENVARLSLHLDHIIAGEPLHIHIDDTQLDDVEWPDVDPLYLEKVEDQWRVIDLFSHDEKGPHRYGPFKNAFQHRMIFVYGTQGTKAENLWAFEKARFDAESFGYRGNGSIDMIADTDFDPNKYKGRSVILYGHADMNAAWDELLDDSPVQLKRGLATIGDHTFNSDNYACLFLQPKPNEAKASVAVVGGTGLPGLNTTNTMAYFTSGVGYPDCLLVSSDCFLNGNDAIAAAGFFGLDWSVENGEFAFRE